MGRTTRSIPSDSNGSDGKDTLISYAGCGCAGGLVTTVQGPLVPQDDAPETNARRKQKSYADILGRTFKSETFEWDGSSAYSTVVNTFNGRDQVTQSRQYAGTTSSSTYQDTTATFDGHGRLATSHKPEQRDGSTLKYTTYSYNRDDSISTITDGRGAVTTFTYENASGTPKRPLVTGISWTVPGGSGITDPTDVSFTFDNAGNRTSMTDGLGTVAYTYNSLSQLTSETRDFTDTLANSPGGSGVYELEYSYHIGGQLKSYKDPWDEEVAYSHDATGRLSAVTGSSFDGVTSYANNPQYRAWRALKHLEFSNGYETDIEFDDGLRASNILTESSSVTLYDRSYEYYKDGRLKLADESSASGANKFDRSYTWDHQGRIKHAKSGVEAHGGTETNLHNLPYRQSYEFDAFGNVTSRDSTLWNYTSVDWDFGYSYANNRRSGAPHDNDGRDTSEFSYDAAGRMVGNSGEYHETTMAHDADGRETKRSNRTWDHEEEEWDAWKPAYFIHSSVLGRIISEANETGKKRRKIVMAAGAEIARQAYDDEENEVVGFIHRDAAGISTNTTKGGTNATFDTPADFSEELDPLGNNVGSHGSFARPAYQGSEGSSPSPIDPFAFDDATYGDCELDGIVTPCSMALRTLRSGSIDFRQSWMTRQFANDVGITVTPYFNSDGGDESGPLDLGDEGGVVRVDTNGTWSYWVDISWDQQELVPLGDVWSDSEKLINKNKNCSPFINSLLRRVAQNTNNPSVEKPFENVGVDFSQQLPTSSGIPVAGRGIGRFDVRVGNQVKSVGAIGITPKYKSAGTTEYGLESIKYNYIITFIHESIHVAGTNGRYTDLQLAMAAMSPIAIGDKAAYDLPEWAAADYKWATDNPSAANYSQFWDKLLKHFCQR